MKSPEMGPRKPEEEIINPEIKEKKEFEPTIPRGWTFLKHGTNLLNWGDINPYTSDKIELERPLSTVSREQFELDQEGGKYNTSKTYGIIERPKGMTEEDFTDKNKPFEMRIMFYQDHARHTYDPEYKKGLEKETMDNINKYYYINIQQGRHPLVPKKEILVKLGQTKEDDKDVFYFVPESVSEAYLKESSAKTEKQKTSQSRLSKAEITELNQKDKIDLLKLYENIDRLYSGKASIENPEMVKTEIEETQKIEGLPTNLESGVPLFITKKLRKDLKSFGVIDEEINELKPEEAWELLKNKLSGKKERERKE